jgi:DNA-binding protein YbaB
MSLYDELSRQLDQAEQVMRDAEDRLGNFAELRPTLAGLTGRAEAADGHVVVEWTATGLSDLRLDPRAMRLPSQDLAAAITSAVRAAVTDLREQTRSALAQAGIGAGSAPSSEDTRAALAALRESTMQNARRAAADIDRAAELRRQSGR